MHGTFWVMLLICVVIYGACFASAKSQPSFNEKNPRVQLVSEFVRELEVLYRLQETAKKEFAEDSSASGKLTTGIRVGTRTVFEMNESVDRLDGIALAGQWAQVRDMLKQLDAERISVAQEMIQMAKTMMSGPKPGIDYGAMAAHAPELTAKNEQLDKAVFTMSQAMFFALVDDQRVAPDGKLHHGIQRAGDDHDQPARPSRAITEIGNCLSHHRSPRVRFHLHVIW